MANEQLRGGVSQETDELSSALLGEALDAAASGEERGVLVVVEDADGNDASFELADDGPEALLFAARERVIELGRLKGDRTLGIGEPVRYALVYDAAVADESGAYQDAIILEFGERGWRSYSAYCYVEGRGEGDLFQWTAPAPAGEVDPLL